MGTAFAHAVLGLLEWAQGAGLAGALLFGLVYVLGTLLFFPGSILTLGAGFLYGLFGGFAVVVPGSVLGALLAFHYGFAGVGIWTGIVSGLGAVGIVMTGRWVLRERFGLLRVG